MKADHDAFILNQSPRSFLKRLIGQICIDGSIVWQNTTGPRLQDEEAGIKVNFSRSGPLLKRKGKSHLQEILEQNKVDWIWQAGESWFIDLDKLKNAVDFLLDEEWATGVELVTPNEVIEQQSRRIEFVIYKEDLTLNRKTKIFLSHKSEDKVMIRTFNRVLNQLGFHPWLDEDAMPAGTHLERGLLAGFEESCAAVFFITPNFKDEKYLATEVDYAIRQKRKKGDRFSIITIVFKDNDGNSGIVPELLKDYLWKTPTSEIDALNEILKALPIEVGPVQWRASLKPIDEAVQMPEEKLTVKVPTFHARYMGQDSAGATCPRRKQEANYVSYWFEINLFSPSDTPISFAEISVVFAAKGTAIITSTPGSSREKQFRGGPFAPKVNTLTLPLKQWDKDEWIGGVAHGNPSLLDACDEIFLELVTVNGNRFKHPLGNVIEEPH